MKRSTLTALLLSVSLLIPAMPVLSQTRGGHRGQTEQKDKKRPGNNHDRPGGNSHNRPGGNSYQRPGSGSSMRPSGNHGHGHPGNWHPAPPPPGPRPHPHFTGYRPRPAVGINVSFGGVNLFYSNGLYYNRYSPTQYIVTLPPLGLIVSQIFDPVYQWVNNGYYFVSQGVVYAPVQTPYGIQYRVVDYLY